MSSRARIELGDGYGRQEDSSGTPILNAGWSPKARETEAAAYEHLRAIRTARAEERAAAAKVESHVQQLRAMGASWSVIAAAVGTSRAAAHKRYGSRELTTRR